MDYNTGRYAMVFCTVGIGVVALFFTAIAVFSPPRIEWPRNIATGELAWRSVAVKAGTTGDVERLFVAIGDPVNAGDPLMRLDAEATDRALDDAQKRLETAEEELEGAEEELESANEQLDYARGRYAWTRSMYERGAVARMELVRTEDEREFAMRLYERALSAFDDAKREYDEAKELLVLMEDRFDAAFVTAPADGFVATLSAWEGGSYLRGEEMMTIAVAGEVFARASLPADDGVGMGGDVWVVVLIPFPRVYTGYVAAYETDGAILFRLRLDGGESHRGLFVMGERALILY